MRLKLIQWLLMLFIHTSNTSYPRCILHVSHVQILMNVETVHRAVARLQTASTQRDTTTVSVSTATAGGMDRANEVAIACV